MKKKERKRGKKIFYGFILATVLFFSFYLIFLQKDSNQGEITGQIIATNSYKGAIEKSDSGEILLRPDIFFLFTLLQERYGLYNDIEIKLIKESKISPHIQKIFFKGYGKSLIPVNERNENFRYINSLYSINNEDYFGNLSYSDNHLLVALYCDFFGYDDSDFNQLVSMKQGEGDYNDVHLFFYMTLINNLNCYDSNKLNEERNLLIEEMIDAQEKENSFSDLFVERIVLLYWGGYGDLVQEDWIELVRDGREELLTKFNEDPTSADPHALAFSELALIYYEEGKNKQDPYIE